MYGSNITPIGNGYSATQPSSGASSPFSSYLPGGGSSSDVLSLSGQQGEGESKGFMGKIKDFGKGIFKGAVNTVTSLFSLKGLAMTLGSVALVAVAGPVAIPLLIAGGLIVGGKQVAEGVMSGDWEKAGEGAFTLGATALGAKMAPKKVSVTAKNGATTTTTTYALTNSKGAPVTGFVDGTIARFKALLPGNGGKVYQKLGADGNIATGSNAASKGAFGLAKDTAASKFSGISKQAKTITSQVQGKFKKPTDVPPTKQKSIPELTEVQRTQMTEKFNNPTDIGNITKVQSAVRRHQAQVKVKQLKAEQAKQQSGSSSGGTKSAVIGSMDEAGTVASTNQGETSTSNSGGILDRAKGFLPKFDSPSMTGVVLGTTTAAGMGGGLQTAEDEAAAQQGQIYQ